MIEKKKALPILFAVMFLVMSGFGVIIPVIPFYAEEIGANPSQLGLLMAVYSLMQFIFAPLWGRVSDRYGRKPVMLIGILGLSLSFFLMALSSELWMLFVARIIGGTLSAANMPTAMAYVADITTEEDRAKGMGMIGAATGLGFIFGPAIGGIFSQASLSTPFYVAGSLSLITSLFVLFVLKESLPATGPGESRERPPFWEAFKGTTSILFILNLFVSLSLAGLEATFAYFASQKAGLQPTELGIIFMIMGFGSALVQGGLVGKLSKKYGEGAVIQGGIIVSVIGMGLILTLDNFLTAAIFLTIFGMGNGAIRPAVSSLLTKSAKGAHGNVTGLLSSFDSLGRILGPPLGGLLFTVSIGFPYISGIILSICALLLFQVYRMKAPGKKSFEA